MPTAPSGFDTLDKFDLPSYQRAPLMTTLPTGGASPGVGATGGVDWSKVGGYAGLAGSIIAGLSSGGNNPIAGDVSNLRAASGRMGQQGADLFQRGSTDLAGVMKWLQAMAGGDPGALAEATRPERGRIMDQYDAARKTIARNTPRGAGQASTVNESYIRQASDIANVMSSARQGALSTAAQVGGQELSAGLSAEQQSAQILANTLYPTLQADQQDSAKTWETIGSYAALAAMFI